jgi:hypothetical protein
MVWGQATVLLDLACFCALAFFMAHRERAYWWHLWGSSSNQWAVAVHKKKPIKKGSETDPPWTQDRSGRRLGRTQEGSGVEEEKEDGQSSVEEEN